MSLRAFGASLACFYLLLSGPAQAEPWVHKSFLMPDGSVELTGDPARPAMAGFNLSRNAVGRPINLEPHLYWAVSDDLSLGISHQTGLCFNECGKVYNDAGFDLMLFLAGSNRFELDLHAGVPISSFDPFVIGVRAGVIGRVNLGQISALVFDPSLYVGLSRRRLGNREGLDMPFWFYFQATEVLVPFVGSAVSGPLDGYFDDFAMPLEAGLLFDVARDVDVGFSLRFHHLLGPDGNGDARGLYFLGRFRF